MDRRHAFRIQGKLATPSFGELLLARRQPRVEDEPQAPPSLSSTALQIDETAGDLVVVKKYSSRVGPTLFDVARNELAVVEALRSLAPHPNVVRYFEAALVHCGTAVDALEEVQLVMEFCERGDLFAMLSRQPSMRVDEARALDIIAEVGSGLAFLHAHEIYHGNISLENVLVDSTGRCKLSDFRLSQTKIRRGDVPPLDPANVRILANVDYQAPERMPLLGETRVHCDPVAQDIWALGVVLFTLTTGMPLVSRGSGRTQAGEAMRILTCAGALRLWNLDHLLSADATSLLSKLLAVDPAKRFQSVEEVLNSSVLAGRHN